MKEKELEFSKEQKLQVLDAACNLVVWLQNNANDEYEIVVTGSEAELRRRTKTIVRCSYGQLQKT